MLGAILLYWIGKYFYRLAEEYHKSKWSFAILGIIVYYAGVIVFAFLFGMISEIISPGFFDNFNETILSLIALPFGLLSCYILYSYLKKTWQKNTPSINNTIDQIGKTGE